MNHIEIKSKLLNQLSVQNMGDKKIYSYLINMLNDHKRVVIFMTKEGYQKWYVNKLRYDKLYNQKKYKQLKLNTSQ